MSEATNTTEAREARTVVYGRTCRTCYKNRRDAKTRKCLTCAERKEEAKRQERMAAARAILDTPPPITSALGQLAAMGSERFKNERDFRDEVRRAISSDIEPGVVWLRGY